MRLFSFLCLLFIFSKIAFSAPIFELTPLGTYGGFTDANLSAYLLKPMASDNYVMLDAGTLVHGLEVAVSHKAHRKDNVKDLLKHHIPAYLISHAHLDHVIGLVMAQPELREHQTLMAREETMLALQKHVFNWSVWGNFGDSGDAPQLNYQHYETIPLQEWVPISKTNMQVKAFPLSHGKGFASTAFLVRYTNEYILYFGDTGADTIEQSFNMRNIWLEIAPLIRNKQLHAIMLECSFTNVQPDDKLFGHLKPDLFLAELDELAHIVNPADPKNSLHGLPVIITHIKPSLADSAGIEMDIRQQIYNELSQKNALGVKLILPEQGDTLVL